MNHSEKATVDDTNLRSDYLFTRRLSQGILEPHRLAQTKGREKILADYRLRVAEVVRDYGLKEREQAPTDSRECYG